MSADDGSAPTGSRSAGTPRTAGPAAPSLTPGHPAPAGGVPLPAPAESVPTAVVVARLRAAGCVFAEDEADLLLAEAPSGAVLETWIGRRAAGEPLEQIVGWAEFDGLRVAVEPGTFVPRRRSQLLVAEALAVIAARPPGGPPPVVVDLCCGTGAVGIAVACRADVELHAADIDPVAVHCTRRNLARLLPRGARAFVRLGDLDASLPGGLCGRVAVLTANAPYVPTAEIALMPPEARDHEPRVTLDGGDDGLDLHRRIAGLAPRWLAPGGVLLIETSVRQAPGTARAMAAAGLAPRVVRDEELDATAVVGTRRD